MEKRARFESRWLPYALIAPQLAITIVFFFLPASQALYQSLLVQDAFGTNTQFVWFDNFKDLFRNDDYLASFRVTAVFSVLVAALGPVDLAGARGARRPRAPRRHRLQDAADLALRGRARHRGGAVAVPVQSRRSASSRTGCRGLGIAWDPLLDGTDALIMVVIAAVWKQISYNFLFFLAGLQSIPKSLIEAAAIDGAGPVKRFVTIVFPLLSPTTFFLLVVNIVYAFFDTFGIIDAATGGGPGQATADPRLQGVRRRLQGPRPRRLGRAVGRADGDRHRADRRAVPLRRAQGAVLIGTLPPDLRQ